MRRSLIAFSFFTSVLWAGGAFAQSDDGTAVPEEIPEEVQEVPEERPVEEEVPVSSSAAEQVEEIPSSSSATSVASRSIASSSSSLPSSASSIASSVVSSVRSSLMSVQSSSRSVIRVVSSRSASSVTSSSVGSSSSLSSAQTASGTVAGFWDRQRFGYTHPVIRGPQFSLESRAIIGNLSLGLLFALVIGCSGIILRRLLQTDAAMVRWIFGRLPAQLVVTFVLWWVVRLLVPTASAQGFADAATASFLQIPLFAFLFFLVVGLSNVLFNNMLVAEGDTIHGYLLSKPWVRTLHREGLSKRAWFILILSVLYGLIGGYVNPEFSILPSREVGIIVVTVFTIMVSVYLKDLMAFGISRKWKHPSWFQAHVGGLLIAFLCVLLTRVFGLDPGYIYGIPAGFILAEGLSRKREGLMESLGLFWVVILAFAVWLLGIVLSGLEVPFDILNLLFVILIEDAFLDMLPLPSLAGEAIFRWKKVLWFLQFTLISFLLFHTLFNPEGTITGLEQSPPAFVAVLLLGCYAVGILLLWGFVAWRKRG